MAGALVRPAVSGLLLGACLYTAHDVAGEYTTYVRLRDQGLQYAEQDEELAKQIGRPFEDGPWYNASIGITQSGHVATVTFPLKGSRQITDVSVRGVRRPGYFSLAFYNLLGPAEWKVMDCTAMAPALGGRVVPRSLIPAPPVPTVVDGKAVPGTECEECSGKGSSRGEGTQQPGKGANAAAASASAGGAAAEPGAVAPAKRPRRFWLF